MLKSESLSKTSINSSKSCFQSSVDIMTEKAVKWVSHTCHTFPLTPHKLDYCRWNKWCACPLEHRCLCLFHQDSSLGPVCLWCLLQVSPVTSYSWPLIWAQSLNLKRRWPPSTLPWQGPRNQNQFWRLYLIAYNFRVWIYHFYLLPNFIEINSRSL